jgi:hypothetical protein
MANNKMGKTMAEGFDNTEKTKNSNVKTQYLVAEFLRKLK